MAESVPEMTESGDASRPARGDRRRGRRSAGADADAGGGRAVARERRVSMLDLNGVDPLASMTMMRGASTRDLEREINCSRSVIRSRATRRPSSGDKSARSSAGGAASGGKEEGRSGSTSAATALHHKERDLLEEPARFGASTMLERVWRTALGGSALMEMLSYLLPYLFLPPPSLGDDDARKEKKKDRAVDANSEHSLLRSHAIHLLCLALLVLILAAVLAYSRRLKERRRREGSMKRWNRKMSVGAGMVVARGSKLGRSRLEERMSRQRSARAPLSSSLKGLGRAAIIAALLLACLFLWSRRFSTFGIFWTKTEEEPEPEVYNAGVAMKASRWFDENRDNLGVLFSAFWMVHCFASAFKARRRAAQRQEKHMFLSESMVVSSQSGGGNNSGSGISVSMASKKTLHRPWVAFTTTLLLNVSLLPVGFFFVVWKAFITRMTDGDIEDITMFEHGVNITSGGSFLGRLNEHTKYCAGAFPQQEAPPEESPYMSLDESTKYCIGYALFLRAWNFLSLAFSSKIRASLASLKKEAVKFALRHPVRFGSRFRRLLETLRWAKYLAPLIGTGNKLRGNAADLLKKYRQRLKAMRAEKARKRQWRQLGPEELEEEAATLIQAQYRYYTTRRTYKVLKLFYLSKKEAAMLRINGLMRSWAARARGRVKKKEEELRRLSTKQVRTGNYLTTVEKRRLYQLEHQLGKGMKTEKSRSMLLRPNTPFAIVWKVLFVVCVLFEITHKAISPRMQAQLRHKETSERLDSSISVVWEHHLVPETMDKWSECTTVRESKNGLAGKMGKLKSAFYKKAATNTGKAWYCSPPYSSVHSVYSSLVRFVVKEFLVIIGTIYFTDVFVTFFTGELCDKTGSLIPKPFVKRWLLPGIMFQFVVNPMMKDVRWALQHILRALHNVGPGRAYLWLVSFFLPCAWVSARWIKWNVWKKLVNSQNKRAWAPR